MDLKKIDEIKIHFIIGPGRSGTTLLVALLNQYPNCISTPEIHHIIYFYKKYKSVTTVSEELLSNIKNYLELFFRYKKNPLIGPVDLTLLNTLVIGQSINYSQLTKLIYLCLYGKKGSDNSINIIVDKNPFYTLYIDRLLKLFPDAHFLAMVRDYRAYILSNLQSQKPHITKKTLFYYAHVWNLYISKIVNAKKKYSDKIKILKYEHLAINQEIYIKEVVNFFGLEYSDLIYDFHLDVKRKIKEINFPIETHERMIKKMNDLSSPINSDRVNSWKSSFSITDIQKADFVSGKIASELGYECDHNVNFLTRFKYYVLAFPAFIRVKLFDMLNLSEFDLYFKYKKRKLYEERK